nr:nucleoside-diphosphate sugar epimerase/dehydratase [Shouchella lonarensis]
MKGAVSVNGKRRWMPLVMMDSVIVFFAIFVSYFLLFLAPFSLTMNLTISSFLLLCLHHLCAYVFNFYKRAWEYAGVGEIKVIVSVVTIPILCVIMVHFFLLQFDIRVLVVTWMMHMLFIGGLRLMNNLYRGHAESKKTGRRTLIIGAGSAGTLLAQRLRQRVQEIEPIGYLDDNFTKHGLEIVGLPVLGSIKQVKNIVSEFQVDCIIIAIPSLSKSVLNRIITLCAETKVQTQILPSLEDLMLGRVQVSEFTDVNVEDLLGREPVKLDAEGVTEYITGKVILVTGAGGSIGSEVCRQLSRFSPEKLVLQGHGENSIYLIERELREEVPSLLIETEISDIKDKEAMLSMMTKHRPHVIFHAAAHKHVVLMEHHFEEAVKNNVVGTRNVAEAAHEVGVNTFVMISTDKAVHPTSVMGATKRLAEAVIQHLDTVSDTRFVAVRFGNVLGSRGSVIPFFKEQIKAGGPVTVTHPDMARYFMTIPEASRLVLQAGVFAQGGEIFVLDMGEPVKIVDLARNLICLSGYTEDEIHITFTGVRPGEKLTEELLGEDEVHEEQVYPKIYRGKRKKLKHHDVEKFLSQFEKREVGKEELLRVANNI